MSKPLIDYVVLVSDHDESSFANLLLFLDMNLIKGGPCIIDYVPEMRPEFHLLNVASVNDLFCF